MSGKQYQFNPRLCRPPEFWILQEIDVPTSSVLETWAIFGMMTYKCLTVFDTLQTRLVSQIPVTLHMYTPL